MKMRLPILFFVVLWICVSISVSFAQIGIPVTIPQLQQVSLDSLLKLDTLKSDPVGKTIDKSPYWHGADANADTVRVTGVVIVKPRVLTYTLARYNIFIQDTATGQVWGGLNVLTDDTSANAQNTNITALDTGMVVTITGRVKEFGSQNNSLTEVLAYSPGFFQTVVPIELVDIYHGTGNRPEPLEVTCDSFAVLKVPMPSRAEKYEGMYVIVRNVTVNSIDAGSGRFTFVDSLGNQMQMYDGSGWYTIRGHKFSNSKYSAPPVGTKLKYVRGVIIPQSRTGTCGDYTIMPLYPGPKELTGSTYPGDISIDKYGPSITTIRRSPSPAISTDTVMVTYKAYNPSAPTVKADSTFFNYRIGTPTNPWGAGWQKSKIDSIAGDSVYRAKIPPQANNALVSYFVEAYLNGVYSTSPDSGNPSFYVIKNAGLSIYDVQYTPYTNGASGFNFDTVTVSGTVTADTSDIKEIPTSGFGANRPRLWMASQANIWNGIALFGNSASVGIDTLMKGDSIMVRGVVSETNNRTQLQVLTLTFIQRGRTVPAATKISISGSSNPNYDLSNPPVSGDAKYEKWESILVQIDTPYVVLRNADNLQNGSSSNFGEFFISPKGFGISGSNYGLRVDDNGINPFYCDTSVGYLGVGGRYMVDHPYTPTIKTQPIPLGTKISYLRGIFDYSFSNYKLEPRKADDFGTMTPPTSVEGQENVRPSGFSLSQNYPNPFNPSTTIRYSLPNRSKVTLKIYNLLGQIVEFLVDAEQNAGSHVVQFQASHIATGVYFYELRAGNYRDIKKMLLLK